MTESSVSNMELPAPIVGKEAAWIAKHLRGLYEGSVGCGFAAGGQRAAARALDTLDIAGYANRRSMVAPKSARGASKLSPYIRYNLLTLRDVHDHPAVQTSNSLDRFRFRSELLWQDYARHWYTVWGRTTRNAISYQQPQVSESWTMESWPSSMRCVDETIKELTHDGWIVNQTRMWLASQWSIRSGEPWQDGEEWMFRYLLDGSRAANRMGWQWCSGTTRRGGHGFARRQVLKRAREFCDSCALKDDCPIRSYAPAQKTTSVAVRPEPSFDRFGPLVTPRTTEVDCVWLTAESLGTQDPALQQHPNKPVVFVFDERLLRKLRLSGARMLFLVETIAEIAAQRNLTVWRGDPQTVLASQGRLAVTHAPVPGFANITKGVSPADVHPYPWLRPPTAPLRETIASTHRFPTFRDWCRLTKPEPAADVTRTPQIETPAVKAK
jgi:deoxyribodipyrimidine photo-lyase